MRNYVQCNGMSLEQICPQYGLQTEYIQSTMMKIMVSHVHFDESTKSQWQGSWIALGCNENWHEEVISKCKWASAAYSTVTSAFQASWTQFPGVVLDTSKERSLPWKVMHPFGNVTCSQQNNDHEDQAGQVCYHGAGNESNQAETQQ